MPCDWPALLARPADADFPAWFARLASRLLFGCRLVAGGVPLRVIETEAYYRGPGHHDPFAHADPVQLTPGRWYFHRTGGQLRGGSFKGVDVAFGEAALPAYAGMLIRGVELPDGAVIDGPSLTVDYLLKLTGHATVRGLDEATAARVAWDADSPLRLVAADPRPGEALTALRVGLSLKKRRYAPDDPAFPFLFRRYRYLSEPTRTAKGKPHMVLPLLADGVPAAEVAARVGCPLAAVKRYAAEFAAGTAAPDPAAYYGREWGTADLCRLYGAWWQRHGG